MTLLNKAAAVAAALSLGAAPAQAGCWSEAAYQAAQVRELDTMLMVEALRCRRSEASFLNDYNRFVETSRPALLSANAALKGHFASGATEKAALNAYDNYMTTVANRYGAGTEGLSCSDMGSIARAALATAGSMDALYRIAVAAQMTPIIAAQRCGTPTSTVTLTMLTER